MAYKKNTNPIYVMGIAEMWVFDINTGDLLAYTNKVSEANYTSSSDSDEIRAGLGAGLVGLIQHSASFTGEITAADFSLTARQLQTGGALSYNGTAPVRENIVATTTELTITGTPVAAYGESSDSDYYACYVGDDGVNYGVDPETKKIQGFTAEVGKTYCVMYYVQLASAQELVIPSVFASVVARVVTKWGVYSFNGSSAKSSTLSGYLYVHTPRVVFSGGDAGINGSQTSHSTTSWQFSTLVYDEEDVTCSECANDNSVLGYMVYVPCEATTSAVESLAIVGGGVSVAAGSSVQVPVQYIMADGSLVTPNYSDLTFTSAATATATVSDTGLVTGVAAGTTTITVSVTEDTSITATCAVTVTA